MGPLVHLFHLFHLLFTMHPASLLFCMCGFCLCCPKEGDLGWVLLFYVPKEDIRIGSKIGAHMFKKVEEENERVLCRYPLHCGCWWVSLSSSRGKRAPFGQGTRSYIIIGTHRGWSVTVRNETKLKRHQKNDWSWLICARGRQRK